jgi:hypothetical protein
VPGGPGGHTGRVLTWWYRRSPLAAGLLSAVVVGPAWGVVIGASSTPDGARATAELGMLFGLVTGIAFGVLAAITRQRHLGLTGATDRRVASAALAASHGGPVPHDESVRMGALRAAVGRLAVARPRAGWFALVLVACLVVVWWSWWLISPAPWLFALAMAARAVGEVRAPRALQRRILVLDTGRTLHDDATSAPAAAR